MNLFGEPAPPSPVVIRHASVATRHFTAPGPTMVRVEFDAAHLVAAAVHSTDAALRLTLTPSNYLGTASFSTDIVNGSTLTVVAGHHANDMLSGLIPNLQLTVVDGGTIRNQENGADAYEHTTGLADLPTATSTTAPFVGYRVNDAGQVVGNPAGTIRGSVVNGAFVGTHQLIGTRWYNLVNGARVPSFTRTSEISVAFNNFPRNITPGTNIGQFPQAAMGTIAFYVPILINRDSVRLTVETAFNSRTPGVPTQGYTVLNAQELVLPTANQPISIARAGDQRNFMEVLPLPPITISENQFGNFVGNTVVRLEAPFGYEWRTAPVGGISAAPYAQISSTQLSWGRTNVEPVNRILGSTVTHINREERVNFTRLNVMYINVATTGAAQVPGARAFQLRNLHLVPVHGNRSMGAVNIRVTAMPDGTLTGNQFPLDGDGNLQQDQVVWLTNRGGYPRVRTETLHVGTRVPQGLSLEVTTDVPTLRTGYWGSNLTWLDTINGPIRTWAGANGTANEQGVQTATIRIQEEVPGAWGAILGDRLEFTFPHEGVIVLGAMAQAGRAGNRRNVFPNGNAYHWAGGWIVPGSVTTPANFRSHDNITITEHGVSVMVPPLPAAYLLSQTRSLDITFWVSVEAGFEAKFPGDTIDVAIGGAGAALLAEADMLVTVGYAEDPFSIRLLEGTTEIVTDALGTISQEPISDIEITVYEPWRLREGQILEIAVQGDESNLAIGLHVYADRIAEVSGEGLIIGTGAVATQLGAGVTGATVMRFPISRVPNQLENDGPITITIRDVRISGTVVPNVEYFVVVRGSAVAENHTVLGNVVGAGQFTTHPYFELGVEFESGILGEDGGIISPPQRRELRLWEGMGALDRVPEIDIPFFWEIVGPNRVGMVSLRAFAEYFLLESNVSWNAPDGSISGLDSMGRPVTISFTTGNTNANVIRDGITETFDIAASVDFLSGPRGTVAPLFRYNRAYLPLRFVTETFGFAVEMVGNTVIVW